MASSPGAPGWIGPLLAVLLLGLAACGDGATGPSEVPPVSAQPGEVACGRPFAPPAAGTLRLSGDFARSVPAGRPTLSGTVEVTSRDALRGVAAPAADAFLVSDGRIVTMPLPQDAVGVRWELAAGETRRVEATASLLSCEPGGGPLPPGSYELYARVVLTLDDAAPRQAFGGPWPLRLR